jgi:hypothetical protein
MNFIAAMRLIAILLLHISTITFAKLVGRCTPSFLWLMLTAGPAFTWKAPTYLPTYLFVLLSQGATRSLEHPTHVLPTASYADSPSLAFSTQDIMPSSFLATVIHIRESPMVEWLESSFTEGFKYRFRDCISRQVACGLLSVIHSNARTVP